MKHFLLILITVILTICYSETSSAQHLRLLIGKHECLSDADCPNGICLPDEHVCLICEDPKIIEDGACVCPNDMHTVGDTCVRCEEPAEIWDGETCACNEEEGYYLIDGSCQLCPADKPMWDGERCVECRTNADCDNLAKPWCDTQAGICQPCPPEKPYWDGEKCGCATNADCVSDPLRPWCDTSDHICKRCPTGSQWDSASQMCVCIEDNMILQNGKCVCDAANGWYDNTHGQCTQINCVPHAEPFTAKGHFTLCTEHNRDVRIDTLDKEIRVAFLDGFSGSGGAHTYFSRYSGCRCWNYNTYNDAGPEGGHYTDKMIHKVGFSDYSIKFPIYMHMSGDRGCTAINAEITRAGQWFPGDGCYGTGATEAVISYAFQTEVSGYKCPLEGDSICSEDNKCIGGEFKDNTDDICGLPNASNHCKCPFGKKKVNGSCDWTCSGGQVIQDNGTCACPKGTTFSNGWCRSSCNETNGYTWDANAQKCVCNEEIGYFTNSIGQCVYCYGPNSLWDEKTKTCKDVCMAQLAPVLTGEGYKYYPTSLWNEETQSCECNANSFYFGTYPNCKRCQSTGTMYDAENDRCICDAERGYPTANGGCALCARGSVTNDTNNGCKCEKDNQVMSFDGICSDCTANTQEIRSSNKTACQPCMDTNTRFWSPNDGMCVRCDSSVTKSNVSKDDCLVCSNRIWLTNKQCTVCTSSTISNIEKEQCHRCNDRFWQNNNTCYTCDSSQTPSNVSKEECNKCINRAWSLDGKCSLCTASTISNIDKTQCHRCSKHYWGNDNTCYSCSSTTTRSNITKEECERCDNLCWKRNPFAEPGEEDLGTCGKC